MKRCDKCKIYKEETEFDKGKRKLFYRCKKCRELAKKERIEKDRLAGKKYRNTEHYKEVYKLYTKKNEDKLKQRGKDRRLNRPEYFLFAAAKKRSREFNMECSITEQDVKLLLDTTDECPLRKVKFERGENKRAVDNSISLDRIDSTKGYTKDNIQLLSYKANVVKNDVDFNTFKLIVENLRSYVPIEHATDNDTRKIILRDRDEYIKISNREKDKIKLRNIETCLSGNAKKRAKKKNLEFSINTNYIKSIFPLDNICPILKKKFVFGENFVMDDFSATIDRIDNNKGYVKGNIRIISAKANSVKNSLSIDELEFMLHNWEELENKRKGDV